jgi:DNA-binding transcriptional ArsR family regulator
MPIMPFSRVPNWVIDTGLYAELGLPAKAVLTVLARRLAAKDDCGSMSVDSICELAGLKKSTVYKALSELDEKKIIHREYGKVGYRFHEGGKSVSTTVERVSTSVERVSTTVETHPYSSRTLLKNSHQEGACEKQFAPAQNRTVPYDGVDMKVSEAVDLIVRKTKWPPNRVDRLGETRLAVLIGEVADGALGPEGVSDPVGTIGRAIGVYVKDRMDGDNPKRFTKYLSGWLGEQYGDIIAGSGIPHVIH